MKILRGGRFLKHPIIFTTPEEAMRYYGWIFGQSEEFLTAVNELNDAFNYETSDTWVGWIHNEDS